MMNFLPALQYQDIVLRHNKGVILSRKSTIIGVNVGGVNLATPIVCSNMPYLQTPNPVFLEIFNRRKWGYIYHRLGGVDDIYQFVKKTNDQDWHLKSISVGVKDEDFCLLTKIKATGLKLDWLCIDVAFAYSDYIMKFVKVVRELFPSVYLIVGNLSEPDAALSIIDETQCDCIKVGIGVSQNCRTRQFTGFGSATVTSLFRIRETIDASDREVDIMADGGLTITPDGETAIGDAFKALNLGAKTVMSASLFSRVRELANDEGHILTYGNSTARAKGHNRNVEGSELMIKTSNRALSEQMDLIEDSLRSSISYAGIKDIRDAYQSCECYVLRS